MRILLLILIMFTLALSQVDLTLIRIEVDVTPPPEPPVGGACDDTIAGVWPQSPMYQGAYTLAGTKAFVYIANNSGDMNCFRVYLYTWLGDRTSDSVIVATYENRVISGQQWPGRMLTYKFVENYDWTQHGQNAWHAFEDMEERFAGARTIAAGDTVWVLLHSEARENIAIERSSSAYFMTCRVGSSSSTTPVTVAGVDSVHFNLMYGQWNSSGYGYIVMGEP